VTYYDFFALEGGRVGIVVADAAGHGAPAAVVMAMIRALLHTAPERLDQPRATLENLDRRLCGNMPPNVFATACWITLDPECGTVTYALAGHCPPIVVRASGRLEILTDGGGPPLGVDLDATYPEGAARLLPGDTLFLYTDGLTEATNSDREMYGEDRLRDVLSSQSGADAVRFSERVNASLESHVGGTPAADDTTWLVVRLSPAGARAAA
jgi:sigma-B regulation protein RsbU (phosphoserine phosphatase)